MRLFLLLALVVALLPFPGRATPLTSPELIGEMVDEYWQEIFATMEIPYTSPEFIIVDEDTPYEGACGATTSPMVGPFYCPPDQDVVVGRDFVTDLQKTHGTIMPLHAIGHEWAHHIQELTGWQRFDVDVARDEPYGTYTIEEELTADCFAGAFIASTPLESGDMADMVAFIENNLGTPDFMPRKDPDHHGSGTERLIATLFGFNDGLFACFRLDPLGDK